MGNSSNKAFLKKQLDAWKLRHSNGNETEMKSPKRRALFLGSALFALTHNTAWAETWPARPIKLIVPFPAGGSTDRIGRLLATKVSAALGQSVVVENVGGAGGTIGMTRVAKSTADGYTFGVGANSTQAISTFLYDNLPYDPLKDFVSVGKVAEFSNVLLVNEKLPVKTVQDLINLAKAKPGLVTYSSPGVGTTSHLSGELFQNLAKISVTHVPYKGAAAAQADLLAGHVDFMFDVLGTAMGLADSGKLRVLANTGRSRLKQYPDVPTIAETVPGYDLTGWFAVFAPSGVPSDIVERMNSVINKAMNEPDVVETLLKTGYESVTGTPADLTRQLEQDLATWGPIIKSIKAKTQ
ncbi:tripartite tricarboxylate transporter substrate binding protein [Alcaligenaceae bacterium]|nr:tripartite tricarboxylate transporter substrate binding protein [Alcaligenaceae bacterium]